MFILSHSFPGGYNGPVNEWSAALVQCAPRLGRVEDNLDAHLEILSREELNGVDLVLFPELSLTGYLLRDLVSQVAMPVDHPRLDPLLRASRGRSVVVGLAERGRDGFTYNTALFLHDGKILHRHRKVYLPNYGMFDEARDFRRGRRFRAFDTPWGRMGLLICEDAWHLSAHYLLAVQGAQAILIPSASPGRGVQDEEEVSSVKAWKGMLRTTSAFLTLYNLWCNRVGTEDGLAYAGSSCIVDPFGAVIAEGADLDPDLVLGATRARDVRRARLVTPTLRDEDPLLTLRELRRLEGDV